ncbi:MAG: rhamnosyltransferase [Alcanivorax sp.]
MKASVIIPTKNAGRQFENVLRAVLSQQTPWEFDVLVVDSGSTDGTVEFVKATAGVCLHEIPSAEFGHGKTRNLAIALTAGEFVAVITHDALPVNDRWLVEMVAAAEQSDNVAGVFGRHLAYEHDGPFMERDLRVHFDGFMDWPAVMSLEDPARYSADAGYRQLLHFFSDNNACLRRSVWEQIPYPDVDFAEDQLWAKQVIEAGYAKAYANKAVVFHSHTYGFINVFRRSFEEARALNRLFGYQLCPTVAQMLGQSARTIWADFRYFFAAKIPLTEIIWLLRVPLRNIAKQVGYYLGQRHQRLPECMVARISIDKSLQRK